MQNVREEITADNAERDEVIESLAMVQNMVPSSSVAVTVSPAIIQNRSRWRSDRVTSDYADGVKVTVLHSEQQRALLFPNADPAAVGRLSCFWYTTRDGRHISAPSQGRGGGDVLVKANLIVAADIDCL